jgi:hypothetical protein
MSDFLIFKAAFNNSATPAVGTYTAEGATARFNRNTGISPDYYLYNTADSTAVQWFVPTTETTDFEFVADILTRQWTNRVTYFIIADSTGTTRLRMWSVYTNWHFENSDNTTTGGHAEYIGTIDPTTSGGFGVFHQFRVRVRKLTASSSSVEVYVDGTLKLTATAGAALVTCAKIGFVGGVSTFGPGSDAGIKNAYVYDLSGGEVIDRGVLSGAFNRFINWMKSVFALKSDIPTVNNGTLTIQQNGTTVDTFTANSSSDKTVNIQCVDLINNQTVGGNKEFTGTTTAHDVVPSATDTYNFGSSSAQWKDVSTVLLNGKTPAYSTDIPTKVSQLTNDSGFLTLESLGANSIPFHNSYPRCKYLGTSITDAQNTAIKNRTYDDLFIGDYWTINGINWRIVAIDYYYNVGDTNLDKGNIIVMPDTVLYSAQMNETNTTAGAYAGSLMRTQNLNNARTLAQNAFGSHLANHRIVLANAVDASGPNNWSWYDSDGVELPNEVQIYGTRVWGSALKGFDVATQKQQFPLMALAPQFVNTRQTYWLQDVSSYSVSSHFTYVFGEGYADYGSASISRGIRPSVTLSYI